MSALLNGIAPVPHLGVIAARGEEAARFLHAQLTNDFALQRDSEARLAAFCTAKGRMLASFIGIRRSDGEVLLVCNREVLPAALKRLSMFVLRSKVKLSDATGEFELRGIAGDTLKALAGGPVEPWQKFDRGAASIAVLYPADGQPRALWVAPAGEPPPEGPALSTELWRWGEVRSGVADITPPIVEAFVPQMLNYESVGGVNFKKGCYPGQEVVARSQFRGTLKRRAYIVHSTAALATGQEVFHESDREQPTGVVAEAAPAPGGGWDAVVSMQVSSAEGGRLTAGGPDGAPLELQPLPYLLLADV
ncbi:CAF17-like 4Fe-4S cluster assembly/insertion protein YgfZ [Ramlibacter albus]|uniref:Folate-binding protein YgfZ n=1 Tax=Ramlibacter albus TaxID=2079448 RepID=A0A923S1K8_9BURK|nr:folate-binding protein YgfZ [Ramlibacter albus]MBC5764390.1 folate-binding protein YgfZ [Ramlibacter albus]